MRSAEIVAVATRIESHCDTPRGKEKVCQTFRDLMEACSASTFMVRLGSFTDTELRELVKLVFQVCYVCSVNFFFRIMPIAE